MLGKGRVKNESEILNYRFAEEQTKIEVSSYAREKLNRQGEAVFLPLH
jgi:hypothetical protein